MLKLLQVTLWVLSVRSVIGKPIGLHNNINISNLLGEYLSLPELLGDSTTLPKHFDSRDAWLGCADAVYNQGRCGSCWAVSAVGVLNDRFCIHHPGTNPSDSTDPADPKSKDQEEVYLEDISVKYGTGSRNRLFQRGGECIQDGKIDDKHGCNKKTEVLSAQTLVSCCLEENDKAYNSHGCNGGEAYDAWEYFRRVGISTMSLGGDGGCSPYLSGTCAISDPYNNGCHACGSPNECADTGVEPVYYKASHWGRITTHGLFRDSFLDTKNRNDPQYARILKAQVRKIMRELHTNGPVHACYDVYGNFQKFFNDFPNGTYTDTDGTPNNGGHCIALIGWGTDATTQTDYWIARNSWAESFGNRGYFRIARGYDLANIESEVYVGCPKDTHCTLTNAVTLGDITTETISPISPISPIASSTGGRWTPHNTRADYVQAAAQHITNTPTNVTVHAYDTKIVDGLLTRLVIEVPQQDPHIDPVDGPQLAEVFLHHHHNAQGSHPQVISYTLL